MDKNEFSPVGRIDSFDCNLNNFTPNKLPSNFSSKQSSNSIQIGTSKLVQKEGFEFDLPSTDFNFGLIEDEEDEPENNDPFTYIPLKEGEIRLFRLCRPCEIGSIDYEMSHFNLDACPQYTALSYTWGDFESSEETIKLNGKSKPVR